MNAVVQDLLAIGRIEKVFGLRGEIVVESMTDSPDRFRKVKKAYLGRTEESAYPVAIERVSIEHRGIRAKLSGIDSRTAAEEIVGFLLFVDPAGRVRLQKGRHFIHELVGLRVIDQEGQEVGRVTSVLKLPAQDVYVVERHGREILVPAVREFVTAVDVEGGTITVRLIEGMLDEQ